MINYFNRLKESVSEKYMKEFVIDNMDLLDGSYLEDTYKQLVLIRLNKEIPESYISYSYGEFIDDVTKVSIGSNFTYDVIYETFKNALDTFGIDDAQIKRQFYYSCKSFYYTGNGTFEYSTRYGLNNITDLLSILYWVIHDIFVKYDEISKVLKNHNLDEYTLMFNEKFPELGNIEIRYFKNGNIKIKGLSSEELDRLQYVFTICKK